MPERMLFVGRFVCHLDTDEADHRRCRVREVVECIRHNRQRVHSGTDQQLCRKQQNVAADSHDA